MSQEKVDKYKEYKKNRKEILAKQKKVKKVKTATAWAVAVLILAGLGTAVGVTIYNQHQAKLASLPNYNASSFMLDDLVGVLETEPETEAN